MIHLVIGMPRSGTSAMMRALEVGGMQVASALRRDRFSKSFSDDDYKVNPGDKLYELSLQELRDPWVLYRYDGQALKVPLVWFHAVNWQADTEKAVAFMWRNPKEIELSYRAAFSRDLPLLREVQISEMQQWGRRECERLGKIVDVDYPKLLDHPRQTFDSLGWPINASLAASTIDSSKRRVVA